MIVLFRPVVCAFGLCLGLWWLLFYCLAGRLLLWVDGLLMVG